jgi:bifunctional DNase/RNase
LLRRLDSLKRSEADIVGLHLEAASGAPLILLREHDAPHRVLPIFIGVPEAAPPSTWQ